MDVKDAVGTRKVFEDENLIIWEFELEPGATTPCHTHRLDYVFYVLDGTRLEVFDANDQPLGGFDALAGASFAFHCTKGELISSDDKGLRVPATHSARNAGTTRYREILVEKKRPAVAA